MSNPGNGGWAAIINMNGEIKKISGNERNTTNNRMELMAPINALKNINSKDPIEIFTDSNTPKTALIKIKNPNEYYQKLLTHNSLNYYKDYLPR